MDKVIGGNLLNFNSVILLAHCKTDMNLSEDIKEDIEKDIDFYQPQ